MLAPRLAMLMKGTAWAQVRGLDAEKLMDATSGIQTLLSAISTWEEAEELQVYEKFEKVLYKTTQRPDETTQSYVNRLAVAFNEVEGRAVKDFRAFIMLRQSALSVEDKKKVISMVGDTLSPEKVEGAMRQLSTRILMGQSDGKKKVYPLNHVEEEAEEAMIVQESEAYDEEATIQWLADQGDEEALIVQDFEDQLIEVCQENSDLSMCFNSYTEARAKIRDKLRHRGFWPPRAGKGKSKGGKKGGRQENSFRRKNQSLADRIANSSCRRCGQKGHWKQECPLRSQEKEEVHYTMEEMTNEPEEEILQELPPGVNLMSTVEDMFTSLNNQDSGTGVPKCPFSQLFKSVNEEFIETAMMVFPTKEKFSGHCLGNILCGALTRRAETEFRSVSVLVAESGCPAIIDTGASKTVIGQGKIKELLRSLPSEVQKKVSWKSSETVFRFGNNATLPSIGAVFIPFGKRWLKIEVVEGETPFLLSNSFLKAIDADVCTSNSTLRLNQLSKIVPLKTNSKGLFTVELAEILSKFCREHDLANTEIVTHVSNELHRTYNSAANSAATAAQRPKDSAVRTGDQVQANDISHAEDLCLGFTGPGASLPRGPSTDIHDRGRRSEDREASGNPKLETMGNYDPPGGKTQGKDFLGDCRVRLPVLHVDRQAQESVQRLDKVVPGVCQSLEPDGHDQPEDHGLGSKCQGQSSTQGERGVERCGTGADCHSLGPEVRREDEPEFQTQSGHGTRRPNGNRGGSRSSEPAAGTDCCVAAGARQSDQQVSDVINLALINSIESQLSLSGRSAVENEVHNTAQVIARGEELMAHLELRAKSLEQEVADLMALTTENIRNSLRPRKESGAQRKLNLLEIYCEEDSQLVRVANMYGLASRRFTINDGDLSTPEGQNRLWKIVEEQQPDHIWASPECRYWGNFSRWNRSKSSTTATKIDAGRKHERKNLSLCEELYWYQVSHGRHFHLEQPQGSEALVQKQIDGIVNGTYRTVFDMCEAGGLKVPQGSNYLRKRTVVLTTSKVCHAALDSRYCTKQHQHCHIKGQLKLNGHWENISAYAAKYTRGFSKLVVVGVLESLKLGELPMELEELCVPCNGVHERDQEAAAEDVVKRRRLNYKQQEEIPSSSDMSSRFGEQYGPAKSWKDLFKMAEKLAPRVGTIAIDIGDEFVLGVQMLVDEFVVKRVEICRGTERFRVPKQGVDLAPLTYRLTVILNRESGNVEMLGKPEKWQDLPKCKQIRKAKPARMCITVFGGDQEGESNGASLGKNLGEGDRSAKMEGQKAIAPPDIMMPDASTEEARDVAIPEAGTEKTSSIRADQDLDVGIVGHPPKSIPRHGPQFLSLSKEDREWVRKIHHRMGHPDPNRLAQFLKSTHAAEHLVAGSLDFQCDACLETQKGFLPSRQAAIHADLGFNEVLGMDVVSWRNGRGQEFHFVHFLDEGTLFHQGQPCQRDADDQLQALENTWISWAGPPQQIYTDPAREYTSEKFLGKLQEYGIQVKTTARDSHWQLGRTEVHGSIIKRMLERMDAEVPINTSEEFREGLVQAFCAKNALSRVKGYTPEQAVLGISRKLPASITSDSQQASHLLAAGETSESDQFRQSLERRSRARRAFIEADNCNSLRRAMLRRNRPLREPYEEGDWVLYWRRKGGNLRRLRGQWHGPARVVMLEGKRVCWLVHANKLIRASPEQLRPASMREWKAVKDQEEQMHPVKDWVTRVSTSDFFDLDSEEIPHVEEPGEIDGASSGYTPSIMEPEGEIPGEVESQEEPVETNGVKVPIPDDSDGDLMFGDDFCFGEVLGNKFWEIDITPSSLPAETALDPHEMVMAATELRKKRVEVKLKDLGEEDQLRFAAAKDKELKAWLSHKTVQKVAQGKIPDNAIMRCRWLLSWKGASGDEPPGELALNGKRAKARLVVIGYEDPDIDSVKNDAPTLTKDGRQLVLQQVSSFRWPLISFDISTAFLHGRGDGRNLGLHPTPEIQEALEMGPSDQCALNGGAYGRVDAPFLWFCEIRDELLNQGCKQHPLDPCVFTFGETDEHGEYHPCGSLGLHVDDGIGGGNEAFMNMLNRVEKRFKFGSFETGEFKYTGIHFKQWDDGSIEFDQMDYIEKIAPINIGKSRRSEPSCEVTPEERSMLRSLIGALQYAAVHSRPDLSAKVGELQSNVTKARVEDMIMANKVLHEAKVHKVSLMVLPIQPNRVTFCAFSDASFMSTKTSVAHQGTIIFATTPEILANQKAVVAPIAWTSKKVPRVVRSTLSAEAAALSNSVDRLLWLRMIWAWLLNPECEWSEPEKVLESQTKAAVVTDCRPMFDILTRTAIPSCSEHRTTIECLLIRERLKSNCDIRWVTSQAMLADCLTKVMEATALRQCLISGRYSLFDEKEILKSRADNRQRLQWIKDQSQQESNVSTPGNEEATAETSFKVDVQAKEKPHDFWQTGPGEQIRRIHVIPRKNRFVPIGVTGCPVGIQELRAIRETRVRNGTVERDFWTGSRGAAPMSEFWTGETIFHKKSGENFGIKKVPPQ